MRLPEELLKSEEEGDTPKDEEESQQGWTIHRD